MIVVRGRKFRYRERRFTPNRMAHSATPLVTQGDPTGIRALMAWHRAKRNAGCVYRPPRQSTGTGRFIENTAIKALCIGNSEVSLEHWNFLVNHHHVKPEDFEELIEQVHRRVRQIHSIQ